MSQLAQREQQAREFSTHLSLFFSLRSYLLMSKEELTIASLFYSLRVDDSKPFSRCVFTDPLNQTAPVAKGTATVLVAMEIIHPLPNHNHCRVKRCDRKIKREEGMEEKRENERRNEGGVEKWWEGVEEEEIEECCCSFSPFQLKLSQELPPSNRGRKA